jgi:hypothetical protein
MMARLTDGGANRCAQRQSSERHNRNGRAMVVTASRGQRRRHSHAPRPYRARPFTLCRRTGLARARACFACGTAFVSAAFSAFAGFSALQGS